MNIRREKEMKKNRLSIKNGVKMLKKAGTLAVVTALVAGLAGCGASGAADGKSTGSAYVVNGEDTLWFETSDPDVKTAADLKGKRIALTKGTMQEYIWAKELEMGGLTENDVELEYFSSGGEVVTAYVSGQADAVQGEKNFETEYEIRFTQDDYDHIQDISNWCADNGITDQVEIKDFMNIDAVKEFVPDKVTYSDK